MAVFTLLLSPFIFMAIGYVLYPATKKFRQKYTVNITKKY